MNTPARKAADAPARTAHGYVAHVDYVRNQAVVRERGDTTFLSWGSGESTLKNIVASRYDPDGGERTAKELPS